MPNITLEPLSRGLVQSTGTSLFLLKGSQTIASAAANAAVIDVTKGPVVNVTSDDANKIVHLPKISDGDQIGLTFLITVGATGFELRSFAEETELLNGATGGANVELAVAANSTVLCVCTSKTNWAVLSDAAPSVAAA